MLNPDELDDLINRLETGIGADPHLNWHLSWALGLAPWADEKRENLGFCMIGSKRDKQTLRLASSVDDALAAVLLLKSELNGATPADFLRDAIDEMTTRGWRPDEPNAPQIARAVMGALVRQVALSHMPSTQP